MSRLRTSNQRTHAGQLGSHATAWRQRVGADGSAYKEWLRQLAPVPSLAAQVRGMYRAGYGCVR